jgi:hypothetical protein
MEYDYEKMAKEGFKCECENPGECSLLRRVMTPRLHELCQHSEVHRQRFLAIAKVRGLHNVGVDKKISKYRAEANKLARDADSAIGEMKNVGVLDANGEIDASSEGLGDTIEKVLSKFGITDEKISRILDMSGCGCSERKSWFNKIFSYKNKAKEDD